jgi:hypothetical protein
MDERNTSSAAMRGADTPVPPSFDLPHSTGPSPSDRPFWVRPASPFDDDDPKPFALTSFKSTMPRSDSWHCIGRNFAYAYIRTFSG